MPPSLPYVDVLPGKTEFSSRLNAALIFVFGCYHHFTMKGWDGNEGILIAKRIN
jgi:hypothetical protein